MRHPYILLILTTSFWGANSIAGRLAVGHIEPQMLTMWRWLGTVMLVGIVMRRQLAIDVPVLRRYWWIFALLGVAGYAGFNLFLYQGLVYTTALNAAVVQAAIPIWVAILTALLLKEGITIGQVIGLILASIGVVVTISQGNLEKILALHFNRGDIYIMIASLFYALYSIGLRWRPGVHVLSFLFAAGLAAFLFSAVVLGVHVGKAGWNAPTPRGWLIVIFTVLLPSILAQVFYILGVEAIGAARASIFINLIPVFAALFAIVLLGERFMIYHALGFAATAMGIVINEFAMQSKASG